MSPPEWLSEDEIKAVCMAMLRGSSEPVPEERIVDAVEWAEHARIDATLLDLVLKGELTMELKDGETEPTFAAVEPAEPKGGEA